MDAIAVMARKVRRFPNGSELMVILMMRNALAEMLIVAIELQVYPWTTVFIILMTLLLAATVATMLFIR